MDTDIGPYRTPVRGDVQSVLSNLQCLFSIIGVFVACVMTDKLID